MIVPHWREMDPAEFLSEFTSSGPATGATVFPFEVASVVLLGMTTYSTVTRRQPGRLVSMELDTHGMGLAAAALSCIALTAGRRGNATSSR
ncbi:hypothetical protein Rhow_007821 [Rhodococcus wratislaviensis]|uniref:Uncharacterized protein n=1 Tax=Rhodococcus wratislaviensis TaxID=44752 RepID=A0A402CIY9_RHOWR|nr:hypothetical protein Rhow_007821 [Rhodococcus wratislaviensis]